MVNAPRPEPTKRGSEGHFKPLLRVLYKKHITAKRMHGQRLSFGVFYSRNYCAGLDKGDYTKKYWACLVLIQLDQIHSLCLMTGL